MREYFYYGPVCPCCHSPYSEHGAYSLKLLKEDVEDIKEYRCENPECQARFVSMINFGSTEKGKDLLANIPSSCPDYIGKLAYNVPLFWKIELNPIEKAYTEWVTENNPKGAFVVTWPWKTVKFLPILVTEYLQKNPDKRVVIIEENSDEKKNYLYQLKPNRAFEYLAYLDSKIDEATQNENILKEIKWLTRRLDKLILKKDKGIRCTAKFDKEVVEEFHIDSRESMVEREFENDLIEIYGENAIRKVTKEEQYKIVNTTGLIDIKVSREERRNAEMDYEKPWLRRVLLRLEDLRIPSRSIRHTVTGQELTRYQNLVFLNEDEENLEDLINSIKPDLILFQNADNFLIDATYSGVKSRSLKRIIEGSKFVSILLFSVRPELRSRYDWFKHHEAEGRIVFHTWDSDVIINTIAKNWNNESEYSNPLSSKIDEIEVEEPINVRYLEVEELRGVDEMYKMFDQANNLKPEAKKALYNATRDLVKRVLPYDDFSWKDKFFDQINIQMIIERLRDLASEMHGGSVRVESLVGEIKNFLGYNVLFERMLAKALEILSGNTNATVTLIVNCLEVDGVLEQLRKTEAARYTNSERLFVACWKRLNYENFSYDSKENFLISAYMPTFGHSLDARVFSELMLVGSPATVERMRKYMSNRIDKDVTNPVFQLEQDDLAPKLLKEIIEAAHVPTRAETENLENEAEEFQAVDLGNYAPFVGQEESSSMYKLPLSMGEKATLLLDNNDNAILVPSGGTVLRKKDLREISVREVRENDEILVDKRNFVISVRQSVIQYLLTNMNYPIKLYVYEWNGFIRLYGDSTGWIRLIEAVAKKYAEKNGITFDESSNKLSEFLASLQLEAKNWRYIRRWWSDYSTVTVGGREYKIYMVERPKANADLGKIYQNIGKFVQDAEIAIPELERTHAAIFAVRKLREALLGKSEKHAGKYIGLRSGFEKEKQELAKSALIFRVRAVTHVEVVKENLIPYRILEKGTYETAIASSK